MKQQTFEQARAAADAYLAADAVARRAEADKLLHLAELAESYSVHDPEVMVQVLVEGFISIGGEGTPKVSEFLALEAGGLMGCSPSTAAGKLADILDLKHRHQFLWQAVQDLTLESWKGLYAAHRCRSLDRLTADTVANTWLESQEGLAWSAAKDLLDQLIVALDPDAAAQKEALALTERRVDVWDHQHGTLKVTARLSALDARYLDAAVDQFAGVLERIQLADDDHLHFPLESKDELRSAALGVLAHPAYALALLQHDTQQPLVSAQTPNQPLAGLSEEAWAALLANPPSDVEPVVPDPGPGPVTSRQIAELRYLEPAPPPEWALPLREPPDDICRDPEFCAPSADGKAHHAQPNLSMTVAFPSEYRGAYSCGPGCPSIHLANQPATDTAGRSRGTRDSGFCAPSADGKALHAELGMSSTEAFPSVYRGACGCGRGCPSIHLANQPATGTAERSRGTRDPESVERSRGARDPESAITVPISKLRPRAQVVIHLNAADLIAYGQGHLRGSAWIEKAGHITIDTLTRMLRGSTVIAKPIVDLNTLPDEDRYAPSAALREAVEYLYPVEAFPYATRTSKSLQLDHTIAYGPGPYDGKTELGNLAPLGIKAHRAKTAGYWTCEQLRLGQLLWRSPLGYRYLRTPGSTERLDDHHHYRHVCS